MFMIILISLMSSIWIHVIGMNPPYEWPDPNTPQLLLEVYVDGADAEAMPLSAICESSFTALAATIAEECRQAGIAAAEAANYTVGPLDKKTLIGGPAGL